MDNIKLLLEKLSRINFNNKQNDNYNILSVLGVDYKEVKICRLIGDLLNPNGAHGLGIMPLERFINIIDDQNQIYNFDEEKLLRADVVLEDVIDNNRRVDIAIHIGKTVIPIEAKIWAGDQENQICDYYNFYKRNEKSIKKIYYLTPMRKEPSKDSIGDLKKEQYKIITFNEEIKEWLNEIKKDIGPETDKNKRVYSMIGQFIEVINNMCQKEIELKKITEKIEWENSSEINALYQICKHSDEISLLIKRKFIADNIVFNKPYTYSKDIGNTDYYKSQMVYKIISDDDKNLEAWIGMDELGIYLVVKNEKTEKIEGWKCDRGVYFWKRIPDDNKPAKLFDDIGNNKPCINEFLDKILNFQN